MEGRQTIETALRSEILRLQEQLSNAHGQIAALTAEVGRLAEQVATSNDRITELVAIAQRKSRKSRASSVVPSTPKVPRDISEDAKVAFEKRPRPPELPPKKETHA